MNEVKNYFNAEKNESLIFIAIGIVAIALAGYYLFKLQSPFYNGVAYAIVAIALIQLVVGSSVYARSPKDIVRVEQMLANDSAKIATEEIPRMHVVMKNFVLYRWVEIALIIFGIGLVFLAAKASLWQGVGYGLAIQSALMLLLDYFAEQRGAKYLQFLNNL